MTGPHTPPGAIGNTHHPRESGPLDADVIAWVRNRPADQRRPIPEAGQMVGFRERENGPVVAAVVTAVDSLDDPRAAGGDADLNTWRVVTDDRRQAVRDPLGRYVYELVDDPWPQVLLRIDPATVTHADGTTSAAGPNRLVQTRESRLPGSVGWLPAADITPVVPGGGTQSPER